MTDFVSLSNSEIDYSELIELSRATSAGAVSSFFGTTRDIFDGANHTRIRNSS